MKYGFYIVFFLLLLSCNSTNKNQKNDNIGVATEILKTDDYTYLKLIQISNKDTIWLACKGLNVNLYDTVKYKQGLVLEDYYSKALGKRFSKIVFVDEIMVNNKRQIIQEKNRSNDTLNFDDDNIGFKHHRHIPDKEKIAIEPITRGITIEYLYRNAEKFSNKKIKVRGKVTKVLPEIMNMNWIHIQDGSGNEQELNYDLTITSKELPEVGDTLVFEGILSTNKNIGMGIYRIILEDAKIVKQ